MADGSAEAAAPFIRIAQGRNLQEFLPVPFTRTLTHFRPVIQTAGQFNADATADIAMLLMLGASRRVYEGQEMVRT